MPKRRCLSHVLKEDFQRMRLCIFPKIRIENIKFIVDMLLAWWYSVVVDN